MSENTVKIQGQKLTIVVPVHNEEEVLLELYNRLSSVLVDLPYSYEILFVDDGSTDASRAILHKLCGEDKQIALIEFSRNFGKEAAMTAGLEYAGGDAVIVIDADLQDPPEFIPRLIKPWAEEGYDVVYAQRMSREGESWFRRATAAAFYRVMQRVGHVKLPSDTGDFRLLSRRAVDSLKLLPERRRFMKGLFAWIGYRQIAVRYKREPRHAGRSKWNYWALWNFSIEGITGFTTAPLKVATYAGVIVAIFAIAFGADIIFSTLIYGTKVPGYPSLMVVILFLGGVQLMTLGVLGEYVARIFDESKKRPLYLIQNHLPATTEYSDTSESQSAEVSVLRSRDQQAPSSKT